MHVSKEVGSLRQAFQTPAVGRATLLVLATIACLPVRADESAPSTPSWQQAVEPMPTVEAESPGSAPDATQKNAFAVPKGFRVERIFTVPRDKLGSWVSLTTDSKGRLIAGDQGDKGLVRITPAPLEGSGQTIRETIVE